MICCRARIPNKWYHLNDYPGTVDHQCPFKARNDGFCERHHPAALLPVLQAKHDRLTAQLKAVQAQMDALPAVMDGLENPS